MAQPTAAERQQAADVYDRGVSAFLSENYAAAAHWFETAYRLAPSAAALVQAMRSHDRAGVDLRAATLAIRLIDHHPDEEAAVAAAEEILDEARERYVLVSVECDEECDIDVDGTLQGHGRFFIEPDQELTIGAEFPGGRLTETAQGEAGAEVTLAFEAPAPPPPTEEGDGTGIVAAAPPEEDGGIRPIGFYMVGGAAVASAGVMIWSAVDTKNDAEAYEAAIAAGELTEAMRLLENGEDEERRTNILIGVSAGLGATAAVLAIFTDWSPEDEDQGTTARVGLSPNGAHLALEGHF